MKMQVQEEGWMLQMNAPDGPQAMDEDAGARRRMDAPDGPQSRREHHIFVGLVLRISH